MQSVLNEDFADVFQQFDDVVLNHSQTLVTCVDTSELHQLVN